jgi:glycyl-tRNA synthetase beta chain
MQKNNLLVEILTEELPPLSQKPLAEVFAQNISESIHNLGLSKDINYEVFSTPRRLGVLVRDVSFQGDIEKKVIKLMPASVGFDDKGNPTNALEKKLISLGEDLSALNKIQAMEEKNQRNLFIEKEIQGKKLFQEIPIILNHSLVNLPIKKLMSYQLKDGWTTVNFVRPMTNLMVIYGDSIINVECMGLKSSRHTIGHRFSSKENIIEVKHADNYQKIMLEKGSVQVDFNKRKMILHTM